MPETRMVLQGGKNDGLEIELRWLAENWKDTVVIITPYGESGITISEVVKCKRCYSYEADRIPFFIGGVFAGMMVGLLLAHAL